MKKEKKKNFTVSTLPYSYYTDYDLIHRYYTIKTWTLKYSEHRNPLGTCTYVSS